VFENNISTVAGGGAIYGADLVDPVSFLVEPVEMNIRDCTFIKNKSLNSGKGAAIYASGDETTLKISVSRFEDNHSSNDAGGVYVGSDAEAFVRDSTFSGNTARDDGASLYSNYASLYIFSCEFSDNYACANSSLLACDECASSVENGICGSGQNIFVRDSVFGVSECGSTDIGSIYIAMGAVVIGRSCENGEPLLISTGTSDAFNIDQSMSYASAGDLFTDEVCQAICNTCDIGYVAETNAICNPCGNLTGQRYTTLGSCDKEYCDNVEIGQEYTEAFTTGDENCPTRGCLVGPQNGFEWYTPGCGTSNQAKCGDLNGQYYASSGCGNKQDCNNVTTGYEYIDGWTDSVGGCRTQECPDPEKGYKWNIPGCETSNQVKCDDLNGQYYASSGCENKQDCNYVNDGEEYVSGWADSPATCPTSDTDGGGDGDAPGGGSDNKDNGKDADDESITEASSLPLILGATAGGLLLIIIVIVIVVYCCIKRRRRKEEQKNNTVPHKKEHGDSEQSPSIPLGDMNDDTVAAYSVIGSYASPSGASNGISSSSGSEHLYAVTDQTIIDREKAANISSQGLYHVPQTSGHHGEDSTDLYAVTDHTLPDREKANLGDDSIYDDTVPDHDGHTAHDDDPESMYSTMQ
jgi:predicted outer membrane repeat protein